MEFWNRVSADTGIAVDSGAVCGLLNAIGSVDHTTLANAVLGLVGPDVNVADCTILGFSADRNPNIVSVASRDKDHRIFHCANIYARQLFQHDRIQLHLQSLLPKQDINCITVHRQTLAQIIDADLRRLYNHTLGVIDSLAISVKTAQRKWITTHLCKHRDQGLFSRDEIETILQLAPLIATSASRHCRLEAAVEGDFHTSVNDGIEQLCSLLTQRERQVIMRILDGITVEQIASELGVKPTTVITYRSRAYEKLGIRSRQELFTAVLRKNSTPNHWRNNTVPGDHLNINHSDYATSSGTDRPHQ